MNLGLDGLILGPLNLSWQSLTLLLGVVTWLSVARFAGAERALLVTLLVARLWAALPGLDGQRPVLENLLDIVDIRRGGWAWLPGMLAGVLALWWPARRFSPLMMRAVAVTVVVAALPGLLKPAPQGMQASLPATPLPRLSALESQAPAPLPTGGVVNFWATWCGPCRAELPLLETRQEQGEKIQLVNVGESDQTVKSFLKANRLTLQTWMGGQALSGPLGITGFPTTLAVSRTGRVVGRHLGPLSGAQLQSLLDLAQEAP
ncbi:TlpA disulfide reductase family protein [Deinococcus aerophilus]|uniref:Thiol:disulfide interchange protein n=1 Tax=Deinococcus aerophilus TaxID=522488 RepID=A0ABQ2GYB1_9DEIO|nr:TlpA disulfide reductase family protein [Deinococcus aerophilus]GGM16997.1 thiol:disulfide interchange protein [Deinococcus aerophilus]